MSRPTPRRSLILAIVCALSSTTFARSEKTLAYPRDQAWAAAVRFLRVDEHLAVTEKDEGAGYVLFELVDEGKKFRGSLEIIAVVVDRRPSIRFVIAIEDRPSYLELAMLKRLEHKLRTELGSPSPPPAPPPPAPKAPEPAPKAPEPPAVPPTP